MTNSEKTNLKLSGGHKETSHQDFSIKQDILRQINDLYDQKPKDFEYQSDTTDLDDLADELFDALYDHTNK